MSKVERPRIMAPTAPAALTATAPGDALNHAKRRRAKLRERKAAERRAAAATKAAGGGGDPASGDAAPAAPTKGRTPKGQAAQGTKPDWLFTVDEWNLGPPVRASPTLWSRSEPCGVLTAPA